MELGPTLACLEAQLWPAGPRIGSFDGATVGIRRGHPGSICLFCCRLQPAPRLVIGQSSLWSCCFGDAALPAACTSLHFQVAAAAAALRQVRARLAWIAPSRLLLQHASTHPRALALVHTPRVRRTLSDGIYSLAVSRGQSARSFRSLLRSFIGVLLDLLFLRSALSSPGLGCLAAGLSLPVILDNHLVTYVLCPLRSSQSTYPFCLSGLVPVTLSSACRSIPFPFEHRSGRRTDGGIDRQTDKPTRLLIPVRGSLETP